MLCKRSIGCLLKKIITYTNGPQPHKPRLALALLRHYCVLVQWGGTAKGVYLNLKFNPH